MSSREKRSLRNRKVSQRMAVVGEAERKRALAARLEALENDGAAPDLFGAGDSDDEDFELREDSEGEEQEAAGNKRKKKRRIDGGMRKTRGMLEKGRGPKGFKDWMEEAELDRLPVAEPSYLTAAVGPPTTRSARKLCSVCGDCSPYTCVRCGALFCSIRCSTVHTETRCLKFTA